MAESSIEWTDVTWNPVTGCSKISPGCKHCYAEVMARRLHAMGQPNYRHGFKLTLQPQMLDRPLSWRRPRLVFVNSMSDLFHEEVPLDFIKRVFGTMRRAPWHQFQVLTKRSERLREVAGELEWPDNVWMGVSVEADRYLRRLDDLREVPSAVRFVSAEPLLGSLARIDLSRIHWLVAGGESGIGARPVRAIWIRELRDACRAADVPFFFKQWGGRNKKKAGRELDGRHWDEMPVSA